MFLVGFHVNDVWTPYHIKSLPTCMKTHSRLITLNKFCLQVQLFELGWIFLNFWRGTTRFALTLMKNYYNSSWNCQSWNIIKISWPNTGPNESCLAYNFACQPDYRFAFAKIELEFTLRIESSKWFWQSLFPSHTTISNNVSPNLQSSKLNSSMNSCCHSVRLIYSTFIYMHYLGIKGN